MGSRRLLVLALLFACALAPATAGAATLNWRAPQVVSLGGQNSQFPAVGIDAQGNANAAWREFDGAHWRVKVAFASAGGCFDVDNAKFISDAGFDAGGPSLDVAPDGQALLAYTQKINTGKNQPFVTYRP